MGTSEEKRYSFKYTIKINPEKYLYWEVKKMILLMEKMQVSV